MPVVDINGVDLNYEIAGQGKAIVCVHGYTGSSMDWANQFLVLSPKYSVVALDLRGHGKSAAPPDGEAYSIPVFAEDVFQLLKMLGIKKCCLMGHSLGGFTALEFAIAHPEMVAALVLVGTSGDRGTPAPGFAELRRKLNELARSEGLEAAFEYDAANNPTKIEAFRRHPEQREIARKRVLATSVDGYVYAWGAISKWQGVASRLAEIKGPAIIFWGGEDALMAAGVQMLKKGINESELVTIEGVGHSPHWESPQIFNERLLEFLGRINW